MSTLEGIDSIEKVEVPQGESIEGEDTGISESIEDGDNDSNFEKIDSIEDAEKALEAEQGKASNTVSFGESALSAAQEVTAENPDLLAAEAAELQNLKDELNQLTEGDLNEELATAEDRESVESIAADVDTKEKARQNMVETPEGEVVYHNGEFLIDDIDEETKAWLEQNGYQEVAQEFTPEEEAIAEKFAEKFAEIETEEEVDGMHGEKRPLKMLEVKKVEKTEIQQKNEQDALKLLLRIALKVGTKVAVAIARNAAKDKDMPQEMRIALGAFADLASDVSKFGDKLIAGNEKADLEKDCVDFLNNRI